MTHVGCETFLRGRSLQAVAQELPQPIPFSSLYDLQQKFLFYLGHLHREATPQLAAYLQQRGGSTWLIDGNLDNPVYVELVLGELSALPRKLAEAGRTAGPWTRWRQAQHPLRAGRLPRRLVRAENFLDTLVVTYQDRCPSDAA